MSSATSRPRSLLLGALVLFLYLAMEWLFVVTKPSFTGMMGAGEKLSLLATGYVLVAVPFLALLGLVSLVQRRAVLPLVAVVLGCLVFLMVDNFLYTVLGLGTLGTPHRFRIVYTVLFAGLVWLSYRQLRAVDLERRGLLYGLLALVVLVSAGSTVGKALSDGVPHRGEEAAPTGGAAGPRPNVVFVGFDGVEAGVLSIYGNGFDTTPFLRSIRDELAIFENAFPDSGKTTGTTTAMLTGRSPLETRVGFPPQVLLGRHSFLHLPALLNERGYEGFQYAIRYYADAVDLNLRESFAEVNDRPPPLRWLEGTVWVRWFNDELFFLQTLSERLVKRLRYLFFLGDMLNHYLVVQENLGLGFQYDLEGVRLFERFVTETAGADGRPFYAHLHFMSTHCCRQNPRSRAFGPADFPGSGERQAALAANRLNAIRDMDSLIERIYRFLEDRGLLEETILVLYSDHSYQWDSVRRVPLMLRFPEGANAGARSENVLLSMVPALLTEPLGIDRPAWMRPGPGSEPAGSGEDGAAAEPLFGLSSFDYRRYAIGAGGLSKMTDPGPPNWGIRELSMIVCSRWYKASLPERRVVAGEVLGHTAPCPDGSFPDRGEVVELFEAAMAGHGLVWGG